MFEQAVFFSSLLFKKVSYYHFTGQLGHLNLNLCQKFKVGNFADDNKIYIAVIVNCLKRKKSFFKKNGSKLTLK